LRANCFDPAIDSHLASSFSLAVGFACFSFRVFDQDTPPLLSSGNLVFCFFFSSFALVPDPELQR
jgi:hypothetical protein